MEELNFNRKNVATAKEVRKVLKGKFTQIKFTVRSIGRGLVQVYYSDGLTCNSVKETLEHLNTYQNLGTERNPNRVGIRIIVENRI